MLFTLGLVGIIVLVLGCGLFLGLAPVNEPESAAVVMPVVEAGKKPSRFFASPAAPEVEVTVAALPAPSEAEQARRRLLLELAFSDVERHIRLEEAALERFVEDPSASNLHTPTASALLN